MKTGGRDISGVTSNVLRFENFFHMGVSWTLAVIFSYLKLIHQRVWRSAPVITSPRLSPENAPVDGLACIVTGASSGIGKATAEALALQGYHVILGGRSMTRLLQVMSELKEKHSSLSLEALELDLRSPKSILAFTDAVCETLEKSHPPRRLQLLVNNAGILACTQRWTADGLDSMIASNYLGPFLLSQQLVPVLRKGSSHPRIVNVASFTHRCVKKIKFDEELLAHGCKQSPTLNAKWYKIAQIYENSKLCLVMFTYELHRRLSETPQSSRMSILAADPGIVQTNILHEVPDWLQWLSYFVLKHLRLLQNPSIGAEAVIDAALAPQGLSGKYFFGGNGGTIKSSPLSYDMDLSKQLWETSSSLCSQAIANLSERYQ